MIHTVVCTSSTAGNKPRKHQLYTRLFRWSIRNCISVRNFYHHHNTHYYITSLCNRHLHFLWNSPRTRVTRSRCLAKPSCLGQSSSADFASARIPLMALADMLAATGLHGDGANRVLYVCESQVSARDCMHRRYGDARADRQRGIISEPDVDTKVVPKCSRKHSSFVISDLYARVFRSLHSY